MSDFKFNWLKQMEFLEVVGRVAVVVPSYRVTRHVAGVIERIPASVWRIYVVDDCCPDSSGALVAREVTDPRVVVLRNSQNRGVGGATMAGYLQAHADGADVVVKIDGDGQMAPELIAQFVDPILRGQADYTKGNRFFSIEDVRTMPKLRLFGNAVLSFLTKLSSGYWQLFDPTNGYVALDARLVPYLALDKISERYFFESDFLFRLGTLRAVVMDIPMKAVYGDEESHLKIGKILGSFLVGNLRNLGKRLFYNFFLRDFTVASVNLLFGTFCLLGGLSFGSYQWLSLSAAGQVASSGTVMLAALPIIIGFQLLLSALNFDIQNVPREPIAARLPARR